MTKSNLGTASKRSFKFARSLSVPALMALLACSAGCSGGSDAGPGPLAGGGAGAPAAGQSGGGSAGSGQPAASAGSSGAGSAVAGADDSGGVAGGAFSDGGAAGGGAAGASGAGAGASAGAAAGSGGSSGMVGAAGSTSGSSAGCAGRSYKLCEDFESGSAGAIPTSWTKYKGYGAGSAQDIALATDQFHSGKMAVKSSSMATGQGRIQKSLSALGATASKHWGRIYYKVQSPVTKPSSGVLHVTWTGLLGSKGENRVVDIVENNKGAHQWLYNNPDDKGSLGSAYDWTFDDAWHCAEWYVDVGAKSYRFFSDSKEVTSIGFTGKGDAEMSNYSAVIIGATFYQMPPAPFVMWFDDLAIDDTQIGCK